MVIYTLNKTCPVCGGDKQKLKNKTCSKSCAGKLQWQMDNGTRRQANTLRFKENNPSVGRPKGSKNKNPYPKSAAVLNKYQTNKPPSWLGKKHKESTKEKMSVTRCRLIQTGVEGVAAYKGRFKPQNPSKYKGDPTNIVYRSSWELKFFQFVDKHPEITQWASEEFCIPYISPVDNRVHRYFPDVWIKKTNGEVILIEIKPSQQVHAPSKENKSQRRFLKEIMTYGVNQAKWKAAREFCDDRRWKFQVMTEKELGIEWQ